MVHKGQKIQSDGQSFKILRVLKANEEDSQFEIMDEYHEKLGVPVYGMGHDGKLVVAVKV